MASYPPPYGTRPAGSSAAFDARAQKRMLLLQARAQRDAMKAQRELYRRQLRGLHRSSILGPVILIVAGVLLLLVRLGKLPFSTFVFWYGRWWPLIFVAAGLILMLEWAFDQRARPGEAPYVRTGIGSGVVLLLFVVALTGAAVHGLDADADFLSHGFSINPDNLAEFLGEKHEREQTIDQSFPRGTSLSIENPHGDITLTGKSDDNKIHIIIYKQVYSQSDTDADAKAAELAPDVRLTEGRLNVIVPSKPGATTDLTVTLPDFAPAMITSGRGEIHVSTLNAPLSVTANHGDVELDAISGAVTAYVNHRDSSFSAHKVTGDLILKGNADDLNVDDVSGTVSLDGEFYGDTHLEHIGGATSFRTSRTSFSFARLGGMVDISPRAELTGSQLVGPTVLTTRSRNITLQDVVGDLNVTNSNGSVDLGSATPLGDMTINNRKGPVTLTVPDGSSFSVLAETTGGEIANDFGFPAVSISERNSVSGKVASGKSRISISTTHGDVSLRKVNPAVSPPAPPPASPASPNLRSSRKKIADIVDL